MEKIKILFKKIVGFVSNNITSFLVTFVLIILTTKCGLHKIDFDDIIDIVKISVTVLISMLGFSVSIYVFLNNTLQNRRRSNELEEEVIEDFQNNKKKILGTSIVFSVVAITAECLIVAFEYPVNEFLKTNQSVFSSLVYYIIICTVIVVTVYNIYKLGHFTYEVINYEEGLKKLAKKKIGVYSKEKSDKIKKGEFLNLVNNLEVLVERLVQNHLHAKISTEYDTNLKRAICDGITEAGDIITREQLASDYKEIIDYRNLLLQDEFISDSDDVFMGDRVKSVIGRLFQNYLKNELLTGVNVSNLTIYKADLEKASFSNSSLQKINFEQETTLVNTDFRNSTLNNISFPKANCDSVNFSECKLIDVRFNANMILQRANFSNADLSSMGDIGPKDKEGDQIKFDHANFSSANMTHQDIYNVCFNFADFTNTRLIDSKIGKSAQKENNVTFCYADMEKADLLRCIIERCDFQNTNLNNAIFTYAKIKKVNFSESRLNDANFAQSEIVNCKFEKTYCTDFSLKGTILRDSQFTYAIMTSADFSGAKMERIDFKDSVCRNSLWIRTQVVDSDFERCVLADARIVGKSDRKIRIDKCNFSYTDLSNSAIANIEFCNCDFRGADLSNARLINVCFNDCDNLDDVVSEKLWIGNVSYVGLHKTRLMEKDSWRYVKILSDGENHPKGD